MHVSYHSSFLPSLFPLFYSFTTELIPLAQNDIQAMARCHRIGQTKNVKVYRLLTSKTYEMQMFHMSSLKMGLDEAVLHGFQKNSSGEGAMTKDEIEKLLRHGAYDIMNEHKAGTAEAESNAFKEQDIDSILSRRSRKVVHDNTGSGSKAAGGTFSKASFVNKTPSKKGDTVDGQAATEDVDVNDPDFWTVRFTFHTPFVACSLSLVHSVVDQVSHIYHVLMRSTQIEIENENKNRKWLGRLNQKQNQF